MKTDHVQLMSYHLWCSDSDNTEWVLHPPQTHMMSLIIDLQCDVTSCTLTALSLSLRFSACCKYPQLQSQDVELSEFMCSVNVSDPYLLTVELKPVLFIRTFRTAEHSKSLLFSGVLSASAALWSLGRTFMFVLLFFKLNFYSLTRLRWWKKMAPTHLTGLNQLFHQNWWICSTPPS